METVKFILFLQFLGMLATGVAHLSFYLLERYFPLSMYLFIAIFVLAVTIFVKYIILPIADWFFDL